MPENPRGAYGVRRLPIGLRVSMQLFGLPFAALIELGKSVDDPT